MAYRFRDRLSNLPDELLHRIFSFIQDTRQVVQTMVIAKRWENLWEGTHALDCNELMFPESNSIEKFVDFVNTVFARLIFSSTDCVQKIDRFSLTARTRTRSNFAIAYWVSSAVVNYWVSAALTTLQTSEIDLSFLKLPDTSLLGTVKILRLDSVKLPLANKEILLGLKNVESLMMKDPVFYNWPECGTARVTKLEIDAPYLKYLSVDNDSTKFGCDQCELTIRAPHLKSLEFKGKLFKDYDLGNFTSLVTADIQILPEREMKNVLLGCLRKILMGVSTIRSLILGSYAFQVYAEVPSGMKNKGSLFLNLKYLKLTNWQNEGYIVGLRKLLMYFAFVETIVLERTEIPNRFRNPKSQLLPSSRSKFCHLKTMEVRIIDASASKNGFADSNGFRFIEFMMKHAPILHTVIIRETRKITALEETQLVAFCRELQKKAYPSVTIVFMLDTEVKISMKGMEARVKIEPGVRQKRKIAQSADKEADISARQADKEALISTSF